MITQRRRVRSLVLKPFPSPATDDESKQVSEMIDRLSHIATEIFEAKGVKGEEDLYRAAESVCRHQKSLELYECVKLVCEKQISQTVQRVASLKDADLFFGLQTEWQTFCVRVKLLSSIFLYLDRTYVQQTPAKSLRDLCINSFRSSLVLYPRVETECVMGLLSAIETERKDGVVLNRTSVAVLAHMLCALQRYHEIFEGPFLKASSTLFTAQAAALVTSVSVPEYLDSLQRRFSTERERVSACLSPATWAPLEKLLQTRFLADHLDTLLAGLPQMIDQNQNSHLSLLFDACSQIQSLPALQTAVAKFIDTRGRAIVTGGEKEGMIGQLVTLKRQVDIVQSQCFHNNFLEETKKAFDIVVNERENKTAEMLAKYLDVQLQAKESKQIEGDDERVKFLFRLTHSKDVFQAVYKKLLAKRLLLSTSASFEVEQNMLGFFKQECGSSFTSKLEGMFKDIELSKDIDKAFSQFLAGLPKNNIAMSVQVLTMSTWPAFPANDIWLPEEVKKLQEAFKTQYLAKNEGRQLVFIESLASCVLLATFREGKKELAMTAAQASVLLQFNNNNNQQLSYQTLKDMTRIEPEALKLALQSLVCLKPGILLKKPKGMSVEEGDIFMVNRSYTSPMFRIRIPQIVPKETPQEEEATTKKVFFDRQYVIDALIVRIMKSKKSLPHATLMSEVLSNVKFPAKPAEIKARIATLIERDFLERDNVDNKLYRYLA